MSRYFLVFLENKHPERMTETLIRGHVEHLRSMNAAGILALCGPCSDKTAIALLKVEDEEQARAAFENDPFNEAGYYESLRVVEFFPAEESNNYLLNEILQRLANAAAGIEATSRF